VDAIVAAMKIEGVWLLDRELDADHNRSVVTLVGDREAIAEAAIRGVGKAAELIDLTKHQGAHPRLGSADVVPFIPIEGVTLEDCVVIAHKVGEEVWRRFGVPAYFYEAAAKNLDRVNLENVRRGQFEGVRELCKTDPTRHPDCGAGALHETAGAVIVGARKPLIAYNVYLNTTDVEVAKKIGKAVRFSNGGLRFVKGMGVTVRGQAQVSMNLTDFEQTPIARVFEFVKREAARYGVLPQSSEIVGLIPKKALEQAAQWFLQIENFESSMILENRLDAVMGGKTAVGGIRAGVEPFIEQLAEPKPTPGGGSAASAAGGMAAALGLMVARISRTKKAYQQHAEILNQHCARLSELKEEFRAGVDEDAEAFNRVMTTFKAARDARDGEASVEEATQHATLVPLRTAQRARELETILEALKPITSPNMASDLTTGIALAQAAFTGSMANVEINLVNLSDPAFVQEVRRQAAAVGHQASKR
jgi:glutamate formiminotransferase/formiminotetrahydrofolate cyclodeaminase